MSPLLATIVYAAGIAAIFYLNRDQEVRTSKALWIAVLWLMINGSRPVTMWFQSGPTPADEYVNGSPIDAAVFGALITAGVIVLGKRWNQTRRFLTANFPILLFLAYCLVSTMWSDSTFIALKRWIKSVGDIVMVLVVLSDPHPIPAIKRFLSRVGFVLIPASILLIKYYPDLGRSYNPWTWEPMYSGVTTFKNLLGMITLVCALGSLWCFVNAWRDKKMKRQKQHLIAHGVVLAMAIWIFWIANSMTSLSCFVLAGAVLVLSSKPWAARRMHLIHISVAAVITISLVALFFDSSGGMVKILGRNSTLTGRTAIWSIVTSLANARPLFGTGFESFWMGDRLAQVWRVEKGIQEAHNGYLEIYANLGWAGVLLLGALIITGYRNVMKSYCLDREMGSIRIAYFVTGTIYSLTEAGFRMLSPVWIVFVLAIVSIPRSILRRAEDPASLAVEKESNSPNPWLVTAFEDDL